jgi:hypothetical protein
MKQPGSGPGWGPRHAAPGAGGVLSASRPTATIASYAQAAL